MGGMQRAMCNMANQLDEMGYTVILLSLFKLEHFFSLSPGIIFSEPDEEPGTMSKIGRLRNIIRRVRKEVKKHDPDTVLVYGRYYGALTSIALVNTDYPFFISDRASPAYRDTFFVECISKWTARWIKPSGIVAQTSISAEFQRKRFGESVPIKIIPNAIGRLEIVSGVEKKKQVLAVGRFGDPLKGFDRLIEAWGKVNAPEWKLAFAGGSKEEAPEFVQRARELGVSDRVIFMGKVTDIPRVYAASDIFVIPSRSEGFPNALAEAMALGIACISYDFTAGPRDLIESGNNGLIVKEGDIEALSKAIQYLIDNETERNRMATNAKRVRERLSAEQIAGELVSFILSDKN